MAATTPTQHAAVPSETDATDSIELSSLKGVKVKASSILDDDEDTYGPMNLLDGKTQTCWNSDQGDKQWIEFRFKQAVCPDAVSLTFQGGFAAKCCSFQLKTSSKLEQAVQFSAVYPTDENNSQTFKLSVEDGKGSRRVSGTRLRLTFTQQADFYGRVILYRAAVMGQVAQETPSK